MHEIGAADNVLDYDLAFSRELLGKECAACRRAYPYRYFNRQSSSRDGYAQICPSCQNSPRLSTEEHLYRYREMNENSAATDAQRRPDELDYLERDSVGRALYHNEFILKLREILGTRLIVGDAYFLNEFSLYVEDYTKTDTNGVQYIGYIPTGRIQEFSTYEYNQYGVPIDETSRGYRGILMKLITLGYITEHECSRVFGPCSEKIWAKNLFNLRNKKR